MRAVLCVQPPLKDKLLSWQPNTAPFSEALTDCLSLFYVFLPVLCLQPLLKDKLAELTARYGSGGGSSGSKLVLHASEDEDSGSSDMGMDFGEPLILIVSFVFMLPHFISCSRC
jgi:hypothetical protein